MNLLNRFAGLLMTLIVILLPFFIILSAVYAINTEAFVQYEYSQPGFPASQRFSAQDRYKNSIQTVRYVRGEISLADLKNLGVYNDREVQHLVDVRNVWVEVTTFHIIAGVLILAAFIALTMSNLTRLWAARALFYGGILSILIVIGIGIFSTVAFEEFFTDFHHLFFTGDSWLFDYTDSLIQFYPLPFWEAASYGIALFVAIASVLMVVIGWFWERTLGRHPAPAPALTQVQEGKI
ncbi:MAG: TIGR01906 family membrane protein [Anaerolineae bacterium]